MSLIEKLERIKRVDHMIRRKATGSPKQLAEKLNISERQLYNLINMMKELDAPIYFCSFKQSYCYQGDVKFMAGFENIDTVKGGFKSIFDFPQERFFTAILFQ